jgi:cholesterol oxidase
MRSARGPGVEHVDAVVVGSGFGGSVTAYRLAEGGHSVVVLERGRAYPPGSFARAPHEFARAVWDPSRGLLGLFDIWSFRGFSAIMASGLGGGSLVYANVLLRKDEKWFVVDDPGGGHRSWPVGRADLDPHYERVERMLGASLFPHGAPGFESSGKTTAMRDAAARLGLEWQLTPLAVTFDVDGVPQRGAPIPDPPYGNLHGRPRTTCRPCGACDVGCNDGSKNTLDHTYLSAAAHHQADIRTGCEVRSFEPTDRGWAVHYVEHLPQDEGHPLDTAALPVRTIHCDRLVLGAGSLGSTFLLLRNRGSLPALSSTVGQRFSGNGDLIGFVLDSTDPAGRPRHLGSTAAPVITSSVRVPDALDGGTGRGCYIQDAGYPGFIDWLVEASAVPSVLARVLRAAVEDTLTALSPAGRETEIGAQISAVLGPGGRSAGSTALLGMGRDAADGVMSVRGNRLDIDWSARSSQQYFDRLRDTMVALAEGLGGRFQPNPMSWVDKVIVAHPLGGAPMGRSAADGVVDGYGEVFGHPGLFVVDGAAMPGSVGVNPSLTIAAFADRATEAILDGRTAAVPGSAKPVRRSGPVLQSATGSTGEAR